MESYCRQLQAAASQFATVQYSYLHSAVLYCRHARQGSLRSEQSSALPTGTGTVPIVYSRYSTVLCSCFRMKFGKTGHFVALLRFGLNLV